MSARPRLTNELENPLELGLHSDSAGDGCGGLQPAHGAFELLAAGGDVAIQAGVLDGDRRPVDPDDHGLLSALTEGLTTSLLRQVREVAVGLAADDDRDAEEGPHRRVARRNRRSADARRRRRGAAGAGRR